MAHPSKAKAAAPAARKGSAERPRESRRESAALPPKPAEQLGRLVNFRPYQQESFRSKLRRLFLLWARQRGKSYRLANDALDWMMEMPGCLVTFISASIVLGTEIVLKEAQVWASILEKLKAAANVAGLKLTSNADGLDFDAICDLFEHSKLETRLWHSNTICSRSRVIAPNEDTAVGWTGHIIGDEVGRWPNAKEVMEAIEPFMSSNPKFRLRYATTPPPDDKHYTFEIFCPPEGAEFPVSAIGNWYKSPAGIMVHRVDVWDGELAGVPLYHPDTGAIITADESRAMAIDKMAWDRNYALKWMTGGTAAFSLNDLARAMELGKGVCLGVDATEEVTL